MSKTRQDSAFLEEMRRRITEAPLKDRSGNDLDSRQREVLLREVRPKINAVDKAYSEISKANNDKEKIQNWYAYLIKLHEFKEFMDKQLSRFRDKQLSRFRTKETANWYRFMLDMCPDYFLRKEELKYVRDEIVKIDKDGAAVGAKLYVAIDDVETSNQAIQNNLLKKICEYSSKSDLPEDREKNIMAQLMLAGYSQIKEKTLTSSRLGTKLLQLLDGELKSEADKFVEQIKAIVSNDKYWSEHHQPKAVRAMKEMFEKNGSWSSAEKLQFCIDMAQSVKTKNPYNPKLFDKNDQATRTPETQLLYEALAKFNYPDLQSIGKAVSENKDYGVAPPKLT